MRTWGASIVVVSLLMAARADAQQDQFELEPVRYSATESTDLVRQLQLAVESGEKELEYENEWGYLRSLLRELDIPVSSQMLVFSKTSLQRSRISPSTPRALYFNDDIYIGYCHNGEVIEISIADPQLGAVYYTLEQQPSDPPRITRQGDSCLICHGSSPTYGVPGHLVRSVFTDARGLPILSAGSHRINHTSPFENRWGGWYVTGTHGQQKHRGNLIVRGSGDPEKIDNAAGQNVESLEDYLDTSKYLSPHSDLVALMVLEHQAEGHNLLTKANFEARFALHHEAALKKALGETDDRRWDSTISRIRSAGEPLVRYLLFSEEAPLTSQIRGTSGFAEEFTARGPVDSQGRSLREFDLQKRMFKYPCSYLVYTESFKQLPEAMKDYVLERFREILTGEDQSKEFAHLSPTDRKNILEILTDTGVLPVK